MLPAEIKVLNEQTQRKERKIATATELEAAWEPPLIIQFNIIKPEEESLLHHIRVDTPHSVRTCNYQYVKELQKMLKYVQTLALLNPCYPLHINLLAEAGIKHYL